MQHLQPVALAPLQSEAKAPQPLPSESVPPSEEAPAEATSVPPLAATDEAPEAGVDANLFVQEMAYMRQAKARLMATVERPAPRDWERAFQQISGSIQVMERAAHHARGLSVSTRVDLPSAPLATGQVIKEADRQSAFFTNQRHRSQTPEQNTPPPVADSRVLQPFPSNVSQAIEGYRSQPTVGDHPALRTMPVATGVMSGETRARR